MDLSKVLRRAGEITWRFKALWVFGFLAWLASGGRGGGGQGLQYRFDRFPLRHGDWIEISVIVFLVLLAILIGLAIAVLSVIAHGALIAGVRQVETEHRLTAREAWRAGIARFWPLLGIAVLVFLGLLVLIMPVAFVIFAGIAGAALTERPLILVPTTCGGLLLALPLAVGGVLLLLIKVYADRACVLEEKGVLEALQRGWEVLRTNVGNSLLVGVILLLIGAVVGAIFFGGAASLIAPMVAMISGRRYVPWAAAPFCCLGFIGLLLAAFVGSLLETFVSATWTLAYLALSSKPKAESASESAS